MSKLTLDALKGRANEIASEELLGQISGGLNMIVILHVNNT